VAKLGRALWKSIRQLHEAKVRGQLNTAMTLEQLLWALGAFFLLVFFLYRHIGFSEIGRSYGLWFRRDYWTDYNTVEFLSWFTKALIIVPGLIFGISLWWLYFLTLFTSATLVWASYRKVLPTLIGFNTIWIFISIMVLAQNLVK
jgi:hypothetical protein